MQKVKATNKKERREYYFNFFITKLYYLNVVRCERSLAIIIEDVEICLHNINNFYL